MTAIPITRSKFVANARSALGMPTLYWLGYGNDWKACKGWCPQPGQVIDPVKALADKRDESPEVAAEYEQGMVQAGLTIANLHKLACDCSLFVAWALQIRHQPSPFRDGKFTTPTIHADAHKARPVMFRERGDRVEGAMLVFPPRGPKEHGHIGILVRDEAGGAIQVIHCSPYNYLLEPAAGRERNAIAQTGTKYFDQHGAIVVDYIGFQAEPGY